MALVIEKEESVTIFLRVVICLAVLSGCGASVQDVVRSTLSPIGQIEDPSQNPGVGDQTPSAQIGGSTTVLSGSQVEAKVQISKEETQLSGSQVESKVRLNRTSIR